ncbi:MAG: hypothetical protein QOE61_4894 [Micromonosporaceae bacterium]|nr:hypothetical protein [Micromonosporaceae bacterium]
MHTVGPYRLVETLGACEVGEVCSAVDAAGQRFTLAILSASAAGDQRWRDAFAATAYALSHALDDALPVTGADFAADAPWVACADEPGLGAAQVFLALGLQYRPAAAAPAEPTPSPATPEPTTPEAALTQPAPAQAVPAQAVPAQAAPAQAAPAWEGPTQAAPIQAVPVRAAPVQAVPAQQMQAHAMPVQAVPAQAVPAQAVPAQAVPAQAVPAQAVPVQAVPAQAVPVQAVPAQAVPVRAAPIVMRAEEPAAARSNTVPPNVVPPERMPSQRHQRVGPWLVAVAMAGLVVGVTAGVIVGYRWQGVGPAVAATASPGEPVDLGLPTAPPAKPGVEPPQRGGWPAQWPKFSSTDRTRSMRDLAGVGFAFQVPEKWDCVQRALTSGYALYTCGDGSEIRGDLIVRRCPQPCNDDRRTAMRRSEEAWNLNWIRTGVFATWAESGQVDGTARYGLIYLGYWRSVPEDGLDRQVVFRMTSPVDRADELRKVANSIRDVTFTL